jgi:hypothetical protein
MSRCSGILCRNRGSGYVKGETDSESARELEKRMADLCAARDAQDAKIWGTPATNTTSVKLFGATESKPLAPQNSVIYVPPRSAF